MSNDLVFRYLNEISERVLVGPNTEELVCRNEDTPEWFAVNPRFDVTVHIESFSFASNDINKLFLVVSLFLQIPHLLSSSRAQLIEFLMFASLNNNISLGFADD